MNDYIKREDAIKALCKDCAYKIEECNETYRCEESQIILDIPAADVRENVRGRWEVNTILSPPFGFCSVCGAEFGGLIDYNFCPSCGADMRGANDG